MSKQDKKPQKAISLKKSRWNHRRSWSLLLILMVAAAFRLWHIGWGLPQVYEEAYPFYKAWGIWNWGNEGLDFNPHFFNYPGFTIYLNFILQAIHYFIGHIAGNFTSLEGFHQAFQSDPSANIILSRLVQVVFDLSTIVLLYEWGVMLKLRTAGIAAAIFAALNPLMVKQAHQVTVDTPLAFFVLAALYCVFRLANGEGKRWYLLAGVCIGLAAASKYTGAMLLPVLLFGHYLNFRREKVPAARAGSWKLFFQAVVMAAGVFMLFNPYILLSYAEFRNALTYEELHMATGHLGIDQSTPTIQAYALEMIPGAVGWIMMICVTGATVTLLRSREKKYFLLLCFPIMYLAVIFTWQMRADRYLLPAIPVLLLACAIAAAGWWERLSPRVGSRSFRYVIAAGTMALALFEPVNSAVRYHGALSLPDTRLTAKQWVEKHIARGSILAMTPNGVSMFSDGMYRGLTLPFNPVDPGSVQFYYNTRLYEDLDYIVASDYDLSRYEQDTLRYSPFIHFFQEMRSGWKLVWETTPLPNQSGPAIRVYQPPVTGRESTFTTDIFTPMIDHPPDSSIFVRYLQKMVMLLLDKDAYAKAEVLLRKRIEYAGENFVTSRYLVQCLEGEGKISEAISEAKIAVSLSPSDPQALTMLGDLYKRAGRQAEAEKELTAAIRADPKFGPPYEFLARIYQEKKEYSRAVDILSKYYSMLSPASDDAKKVSAEIKDFSRLR